MHYNNTRFLPFALALAMAPSSHGAVVTKAATGTDLSAGASWGDSAPTSSDTATWNTGSLGPGLTLDSAASWDGIEVTDATGPIYPANARDRWWDAEKQLRNMLDQPLPLKTIASLLSMSVRTTIRACKAATGSSPASRVRELRIAHATHLLQHSSQSISEIAAQVGFERVQEFSRDYKRRTGGAPAALRARRERLPLTIGGDNEFRRNEMTSGPPCGIPAHGGIPKPHPREWPEPNAPASHPPSQSRSTPTTRKISRHGGTEWQRGWDSNPRDLSVCRFSRPVHSTTLPPLRRGRMLG